jgi:pyruvate carboxylase
MFDTYVTRRQPVYNNTVVHEHRAPTDQSVALLKEMEASARAKIVEAVRVESNSIKAVFQRQEDMLNDQHIYGVFYSINGEKREVTVRDRKGEIKDVAEKLWRALADDMALALLRKIVK